MRLLVGCVLVLALTGAGCTHGSGGEPSGSETVDRAVTEAPSPSDPTEASPLTTRPLVLAVNVRRPPLVLTERQARGIERRDITNWRQVGQPAGPLRTTDRTDGLDHLPLDTVAVVVADAVGAAVRVASVGGVDPLRDPAAYPLQVAGPAPAKVTTMTLVGDIMLGRSVAGSPALDPMSERLASADLTVGNLESALSDAGAPTQDDAFHAPPAVRGQLRAAGFDAIDLANNHVGDFGDRALVDTARLLRAGGLPTFGAGRDLARASEPVVVRRHGIRFGFLGFNAIGETPEAAPGQPGALSVSMPPRTGPLDRAELGRVLAGVRRLERRADVVTVLPHWGEQYTYRPWPVQHQVARELVRAGADLVVGGHPHWVQGADLVDGALVVNSLGNFVFDMETPQTNEGLMLEATFWGDRLMAADFVPYRIGADFAPRVVPTAQAIGMRRGFWEFSSLAAPPRSRS